MSPFLEHIEKTPKSFKVNLGIFLMLLVGGIDYLIGLEIAFSVFYLFPVVLFAWFLGRWPAILISIASCITLLLADLLASPSYSHPVVPYWNTVVKLALFVIISLILSALRRSVEHEQHLALQIQQRFLPSQMPGVTGVEFSSGWQPSRTVSGDYYDVFSVSKDEIGFCIGDVAGHGISAALIMSNLQAAVKIFTDNTISTADLCEKLNRLMYANVEPGKFITFF